MILAGIDYSITSPGITVYDTENNNLKFYGFRKNKGQSSFDNFLISEYPENIINHELYFGLACWSLEKVQHCDHVFIEDYSFGSKGNITALAENCSVLKLLLWRSNIPYTLVAPPTLKKFATGSGRAQKEDMYISFVNTTGCDVIENFRKRGSKVPSPLNDIVDAYWLVMYGKSLLLK